MRSSHGFWGRGENGIYIRRTREQSPKFEGTGEQRQYREHKKTIFQFWGKRGTGQFMSWNKGIGIPL